MKTRTAILLVGLVAVLGVGGFAAWQQPWVRSFFASDTENRAEIDRALKERPKNVAPPKAEAGSPRWRGESGKGVAPAGSFRTDWEKNPPKEVWRAPIGGGYGSCSVVNGKVFVQDKQGGQERVVCLDAGTGKLVWEYAYDAGPAGADSTYAIGPRATPTVDGGMVYAVGGDGKFLALETSGDAVKPKWRHDLVRDFGAPMPQWGIACSPLVLGELVIVLPGAKDGAVVAFDKHTGDVKWKAGSNPPGYSSAAAGTVAGEPVAFAFMGDALLALRPADGTPFTFSYENGAKSGDSYPWKTQFSGNIATPLVVGDYVFISSSYGGGCALLRGTKEGGELKFVEVYAKRRRGFENHIATSVYKDGHLFGIDGLKGSGGLKCVQFADGTEVPDWDGGEIGQASLLLAGDHLIIQTDRGDLCLAEANPKEFVILAKIRGVLSGKNNWASPTLVDGRIYLRDEANVVCLDVKPE